MHGLSDLIGPVFLALVLTIVMHPLRALVSSKVPDWVATIVCLVALYAVLLGLAFPRGLSAPGSRRCCRRTSPSSRT